MQLFRKVLNKTATLRNGFMSYHLSINFCVLLYLSLLIWTITTSAGLYRGDYWNSRGLGCGKERICSERAGVALWAGV